MTALCLTASMANHMKKMEVLVTEGRFGDIAPQLDDEELTVVLSAWDEQRVCDNALEPSP